MIRILSCMLMVSAAWTADLPKRADVEALLERAQAWAVTQTQADGKLVSTNFLAVGLTAFAAGALIDEPHALSADHPTITGAIRFLLPFRQKDGGVYDPSEGLGCYGTSLTLQFVVRLPDPKAIGFDITAMKNYILGLQNTTPGALGQGGIGYGDKGKGFEDLSNTGYAIQALRASGMPADAPQMKAAMAFLQRCQDLSSVNHQAWVGKSPVQGGAVYGPQEAARSWERGDEVAASRTIPTGSMTYQLLSSYLTLELKPDDPRVTAALGWITANYGFDQNPGMGVGREQQGLYHAYALASTTFDLLRATTLTLPNQRQVDWRADLWKAITSRSQEAKLADGKLGAYWINDAQRWAEGTPILCTAYAIRGMKALLRNLP